MSPRRTVVCLLALFAACAPPAEEPHLRRTPQEGTPERLAFDLGLTQHLGTVEPVEVKGRTHTFDPADGPRCLRGAPFRVSTRERHSEDLLIFLQGGGACWSDFCLAVTGAPVGIPVVDVLNVELPQNPFAEHDVVYVPYCDGSLFAGESEHDDDGDGTPERLHAGLHNLSAALTIAHRTFPSPRRVVLAGSSAGAYGTILASLLVRYVYPDVSIDIVNDSGLGLGRPGEPDFVGGILDEFNARRFLPGSCGSCLEDGHLTQVVHDTLTLDENVRIAAVSAWDDRTIGNMFLKLPPADFRAAVDSVTSELHAAFPQRYRRFLYAGRSHTALLGNPIGIIGEDLTAVELPPDFMEHLGTVKLQGLKTAKIGEVMLHDWLRAMVAGDDAAWVDLVEEPGEVPSNGDEAP